MCLTQSPQAGILTSPASAPGCPEAQAGLRSKFGEPRLPTTPPSITLQLALPSRPADNTKRRTVLSSSRAQPSIQEPSSLVLSHLTLGSRARLRARLVPAGSPSTCAIGPWLLLELQGLLPSVRTPQLQPLGPPPPLLPRAQSSCASSVPGVHASKAAGFQVWLHPAVSHGDSSGGGGAVIPPPRMLASWHLGVSRLGLFWRVLLQLRAAFEMHMRLSPLVAMMRTQAWAPVMGPGRIFSRGFKGLHCRCAEYTLVGPVEARSWVQWSGGSPRVAVPWWWSHVAWAWVGIAKEEKVRF